MLSGKNPDVLSVANFQHFLITEYYHGRQKDDSDTSLKLLYDIKMKRRCACVHMYMHTHTPTINHHYLMFMFKTGQGWTVSQVQELHHVPVYFGTDSMT